MLDNPTSFNVPGVDDLVRRWQDDHDERARDKLVRLFTPTAKSAALRWAARYGVDRDDAIQEGLLALMRALDKYDPLAGTLEAYVRIWTRARVGRARTYAHAISVPAHVFDDMTRVLRARRKLERSLGRAATDAEVAADTGLSPGRVGNAMASYGMASRLKSLAMPIGEGDATLGDVLPDTSTPQPDVLAEEAKTVRAARAAIDAVVATLPPRHQLVFRVCFLEGRPLADAAKELGVIRQRVQQIHAQITLRLREALVDDPAALALLGREPALADDDDEAGRLLSTKEVEHLTGLNRATMVDMIGRGTFPRSIARDRRRHRLWRESAVEKWRA